jgi:hypothetical protein
MIPIRFNQRQMTTSPTMTITACMVETSIPFMIRVSPIFPVSTSGKKIILFYSPVTLLSGNVGHPGSANARATPWNVWREREPAGEYGRPGLTNVSSVHPGQIRNGIKPGCTAGLVQVMRSENHERCSWFESGLVFPAEQI